MSRLDAIQARVADATDGPWTMFSNPNWPHEGQVEAPRASVAGEQIVTLRADAEFIAHARDDVPALLAVARAAAAEHDNAIHVRQRVYCTLCEALAPLLAEEDPA